MAMDTSADSPAQPEPEREPTLSNRDVDQLLTATSRTRQRIRKACYPCNKRKIKCDRDERTPCSNCAKRPHPELCTFDDHAPRSNNPRPRPSLSHQPSSHSPAIHHSVSYPSTPANNLLHGTHTASTAYSHTPHTNGGTQEYSPWARAQNSTEPGSASASYNLVGGSAPASAKPPIGIPPSGRHSYSSFQPINAIDTFTDRSVGIWPQISLLLPPQKHLLRFFDIYRTISNPLYPVIPDIDDFEAAVCTYFEDATSNRLRSEVESLSGPALEARLSWFALLSATIATGVQYSDIKNTERRALVQEYFRNAMQLLRLANFLFRPTEICIMSLLLLSRILQNEFQPEASWSILGLIARFAETIGLHSTPEYSPNVDLKTREIDTNRRRKIWWTIVWQESHLTMCFGKHSTIPTTDPPIPVAPSPTTATSLTYIDCMHTLCSYAIHARTLHPQPMDRSSFSRAIDAIAAVRHLHEHALPRLADKAKCRSIQDRMEYFSLRIHQGRVVSLLSQTLMKACRELGLHVAQRDSLASMCRTSAVDCVQAYIDMQGFSVVPARTWGLTFNALGAALLLGALSADAEDAEAKKVRELLGALLDLLRAGDEDEVGGSAGGHFTWLSRYSAGMLALRDMSVGKGIVGMQEEEVRNGEREGDVDMDRQRDQAQPTVSREKLDVFLDPAALWNTYFATSAVSGEDVLLPQQLVFGI